MIEPVVSVPMNLKYTFRGQGDVIPRLEARQGGFGITVLVRRASCLSS